MPGRVEGKVAFITGAARGQGRNHAVRLAEEGADIIAVDISTPVASVGYPMASAADLAETVRLVEATGRRIFAAEADVRDAAVLRDVVDAGVAKLGRLDIVSANAGIVSAARFSNLDPRNWHDVIDINLTGVFHTAKAAVPHLIAGGRGGSIVVTSSTAGLKGMATISHYSAAKHGLVGFTRTLANELAPHFIRANTLHPTGVDTAMIRAEAVRRWFEPASGGPVDGQSAPSSVHPLPIPWIEVDDVTNALLFLVSDEGRYITGAAVPIDAGMLVR